MKSKIILPVLSTILILSCRTEEAREKHHEELPEDIVELSAEQFKTAGIEYGAAEQRTLNATLKVNGLVTVSPQDLASVCAPMGGFIVETSLIPGSRVSKGQVLARIENTEFIELQQQYLEARTRLEYAEGEYQRHKTLFEDDVYSSKNLQEVTAQYKTLKAQLNATGQKLAMIGLNGAGLTEDNISRSVELRSPINGYIRNMDANLGKYVTPTDVVFEIVNTGALVLELTLYEKDVNRVSAGQRVRFTLAAGEPSEHQAEIIQVGRAIGIDKTVKVFAAVSSPAAGILPGMYVNAWIGTSGDVVFAVPTEAITRFDDHDYIFVYERDKEENGLPFTEFKMVEITRGVTEGEFTSIGLPVGSDLAGKQVVVKGSYALLSAKKNAGEMSC